MRRPIEERKKALQVGLDGAPGGRQAPHQGMEARPLQLEPVETSEQVAETQKLREAVGRCPTDDRRANAWQIERHILQQLTMPCRPRGDAAVELRGDLLEDAFDTRVAVVHDIADAAQLTPGRRLLWEVAALALIEERPHGEIAEALGVPIGTVKSRLFRATRALRLELTRLGIRP